MKEDNVDFSSECEGCIVSINHKEEGAAENSFCALFYYTCPCKDCLVKIMCNEVCKELQHKHKFHTGCGIETRWR